MDRERLDGFLDDRRTIPGIHNYCDLWCQRCYLSSRCSVYLAEQEESDDPTAEDIECQAFSDKLHESFRRSLEKLTDHAQEMGFNLDGLEDEVEFLVRKERRRREAKNHPLTRAGERYCQWAEEWVDNHEDLLEAKSEQLTVALMNPGATELQGEAADVMDAIEVAGWFQYFIGAKLNRAVHRDLELDDYPEGMPHDSDGSAKTALIAMDHSIAAWGTLRDSLGDADESIFHLLAHLERLRRDTEAAFPNARAFIRPGFDEVLPPLPEG